jgi:structure-specific recognition protein 1
VGAQRTFDILVSMRTAAGGAQHQFHGIPKQEFQNLVNFLTAKQLKIVNVDAQARVDQIIDDEEEEDHHAARLRAGGEDSGTDEDFAAGSDSDGGEPTDESESDGSDSDGGGDSDSDAPKKKKAKKSPKAKGKAKAKGKKAKKDPNAPKRPLSSYMIFAGENRGKLVEKTPGMSIGEIGKALGAEWKAMTAEEKVPYEDKAKEAKAAYVVKLKEYEATKAADKPTVIDDDDDESDDDDDGSGSD